jgi:hypothetical protein
MPGLMSKYVVVIIALDGTPSAAGPFPDEYRATLWANDHETEETGWTCHVCPLEHPNTL